MYFCEDNYPNSFGFEICGITLSLFVDTTAVHSLTGDIGHPSLFVIPTSKFLGGQVVRIYWVFFFGFSLSSSLPWLFGGCRSGPFEGVVVNS